MSRLTLILDSTQIASFLTCERMWQLEHQERLTPTNKVGEALAAGTYGHHLLEMYYRKIALGHSSKSAFEAAYEFELPANFPLSPEMRTKVRNRFRDYVIRYVHADVIPGTRKNETHQYATGKDICSHCEEHVLSMKPCKDIPLVEMGFSYELLNNSSYLFVLEGRIDFIGTLAGQTILMDHKWQLRRSNLYKKSIQFRNYSLVTDIPIVVINYVGLADKIGPDTLLREIVSFNPIERQLWRERLIAIYRRIAHKMEKGEYHLNESACAGRFGHPCDFTPICEQTNPQTADLIKVQQFTKREEWKPW